MSWLKRTKTFEPVYNRNISDTRCETWDRMWWSSFHPRLTRPADNGTDFPEETQDCTSSFQLRSVWKPRPFVTDCNQFICLSRGCRRRSILRREETNPCQDNVHVYCVYTVTFGCRTPATRPRPSLPRHKSCNQHHNNHLREEGQVHWDNASWSIINSIKL